MRHEADSNGFDVLIEFASGWRMEQPIVIPGDDEPEVLERARLAVTSPLLAAEPRRVESDPVVLGYVFPTPRSRVICQHAIVARDSRAIIHGLPGLGPRFACVHPAWVRRWRYTAGSIPWVFEGLGFSEAPATVQGAPGMARRALQVLEHDPGLPMAPGGPGSPEWVAVVGYLGKLF
jgi:hypothetical protein